MFSVEHPIYTAPRHPGWSSTRGGPQTWPVDRYLDEGPRSTDWLAKGVIKQHRTLATYVNLLIGAGFTLTRVEEWGSDGRADRRAPTWPTSASARRSCSWRRGDEAHQRA